jgi:hypothetical protein
VDERPQLPRTDLEASIEARRELGAEYEPALVDGFLERVERAIEARVDARLAESDTDQEGAGGGQMILGLASLGTGIPITAIAAEQGVAGVLIAWAGIGTVNLANAWRARRSRR